MSAARPAPRPAVRPRHERGSGALQRGHAAQLCARRATYRKRKILQLAMRRWYEGREVNCNCTCARRGAVTFFMLQRHACSPGHANVKISSTSPSPVDALPAAMRSIEAPNRSRIARRTGSSIGAPGSTTDATASSASILSTYLRIACVSRCSSVGLM